MIYSTIFAYLWFVFFIVQYSGFNCQSSKSLFRPKFENYSGQHIEGMNQLIERIFDVMVVFAFFLYALFLLLLEISISS